MGEIVSKRWGTEEVIFYGPYLVKRLVIKGRATSMHWHNCKTETIIVERGKLFVCFESAVLIVSCGVACTTIPNFEYCLLPDMTMTIFEGRQSAHSMRAKYAQYIEASTPHRIDSERVHLCDDWRPERKHS